MKSEKGRRFFHILKQRFTGVEVHVTSVMIAYYLLLSLFPMLIAVGNLLPYLSIDPLLIIDYLAPVIPEPVQPILWPIIQDLLTRPSAGLLSISAFGAIWSSTRGINYLQRGVNKAYGIKDSSSFIAKRLFSLITMGVILLMLVAFVLVFSLGEMILQVLEPTFPGAGAWYYTLVSLKWPVALLFMFLLLLIVYRTTPDVRLRLRDAAPGALLATVGLMALVQAFTLYIRYSTQSFSSYGTLGTFFVLMFWLNFSMMIVLLGAVLNASIAEWRNGPAVKAVSRVDVVLEQSGRRLLARLRGLIKRKKAAPPKTQGPEDGCEGEDKPPAE